MRKFFSFLFTSLFLSTQLFAQDTGFEMLQKSMAEMQKSMQQLQQTIAQQNDLIQKQQLQINALESKSVPFSRPVSTTPVMSGGMDRSKSGLWNPEIGAVADTVFRYDTPSAGEEDQDRVSVRELELVMGSAIDANSRLDATIAFSDFEDVHLDEAYYTNHALPWGLTGKLGRLKPRIGKVLPLHRDSLETIDEPLVIQRYFGPEGMSKTGIELVKPFQVIDNLSHQFAFGVLEGGSGEAHGEEEEGVEEESHLLGESRRHPTIYANFKNYFELTENTGLEGGLTYLTGGSDADQTFGTHVLGTDLTWTWNYADQRHFKIQGESFFGARQDNRGEDTDEDTGTVFVDKVDDSRDIWGSYILADWRFLPRWSAGARFDHVDMIRNASSSFNDQYDFGYTGYLTFFQNEFARWRVQMTNRDLVSSKDEWEFLVQGTFSIGEHKHKLV